MADRVFLYVAKKTRLAPGQRRLFLFIPKNSRKGWESRNPDWAKRGGLRAYPANCYQSVSLYNYIHAIIGPKQENTKKVLKNKGIA
jgi:hypothetical protein